MRAIYQQIFVLKKERIEEYLYRKMCSKCVNSSKERTIRNVHMLQGTIMENLAKSPQILKIPKANTIYLISGSSFFL